MRKFLVLVLVLGMASLANAGLVLNPASATIALNGSTILSLTTNAQISAGVNEQYAMILGPAGSLAWDTSAVTTISGDVFAMTVADAGATVPAGTDGVYVGVFNFGTAYAAGSTIVDGIKVTGLKAGQYAISLKNVDMDGSTITGDAGSMTLTVTPEPATLVILGLGGLLLRRKK